MKLNTIIKLGSLAFNVAQDEKIRELAKLAHNGAKRRGFYNQSATPPQPTQSYYPYYGGPRW